MTATLPNGKPRHQEPAIRPVTLRRATAARFLGISETTLDKWTAEGTIPAPLRVRGIVLYRLADLEEWVARGCTSPQDSH